MKINKATSRFKRKATDKIQFIICSTVMVCGMCASVTCIEYHAQGIHMLDLPCRPHRLKTVIFGSYMCLFFLKVFSDVVCHSSVFSTSIVLSPIS